MQAEGQTLSKTAPNLMHYGVELSHARLSELLKLADAAKPFYDWVELQAQLTCGNVDSLSDNLNRISFEAAVRLVRQCYDAAEMSTRPVLFDGIGRKYAHRKACYYFFAWLLRDAPQQRLQPLLARAARMPRAPGRVTLEAQALAKLLVAYREMLGTFDWIAIREVISDRLEGSRRAIRGRQKEIVVRTAAAVAVQRFFQRNGSYGRFASVETPDHGVRIGAEEFDVVVNLLNEDGEIVEKVLFPVKTRETEGGGHAHIFTRDINSAILMARASTDPVWVAAFIVAQNWSQREQEHVQDISDFAAAIPINPTNFASVDDANQKRLDDFFDGVLSGRLHRKQ
jgi:hypothetical protein